jgi:hypothetical protein
MDRYTNTPITQTPDNPKRRYITVKYPEISLDFSDIYVYTTRGDRYDLLAQAYYNDSSLWWIISIANENLSQDSLYINEGTQLRIPTDLSNVLEIFRNFNQVR